MFIHCLKSVVLFFQLFVNANAKMEVDVSRKMSVLVHTVTGGMFANMVGNLLLLFWFFPLGLSYVNSFS